MNEDSRIQKIIELAQNQAWAALFAQALIARLSASSLTPMNWATVCLLAWAFCAGAGALAITNLLKEAYEIWEGN